MSSISRPILKLKLDITNYIRCFAIILLLNNKFTYINVNASHVCVYVIESFKNFLLAICWFKSCIIKGIYITYKMKFFLLLIPIFCLF